MKITLPRVEETKRKAIEIKVDEYFLSASQKESVSTYLTASPSTSFGVEETRSVFLVCEKALD